MGKVRRTLSIIRPTLAVLGLLAASGHAAKPTPPSEPTVTVTGVITGAGDPKAIRVTFDSSLAITYADGSTQDLAFISNPDYSPSLRMTLNAPADKVLRYYYCAHEDHVGSDILICNDASHSPDYYYCLVISGGVTPKKGVSDLDHVIFPVGSPWRISRKQDNGTVGQGTLSIRTTYDVTR